MLALVEAFWLMGVVFRLMIPFLPLLQYTKRKPPQAATTPGSEKLLRRTELPPPVQPESEEEHHLALHWDTQFCGASLSHLIP